MSALSSARRRRHLSLLATTFLIAVLGACSSEDNQASPPGTLAAAGGTPVVEMTAEQRVAEAKTQAVGYFEALATLDYPKALDRSSGAAANLVRWEQGVDEIDAVTGTPYEVKPSPAPNVRVQFDTIAAGDDGRWSADGFIELGFRPGPLPTGASTTVVPTTTASGSVVPNPNTFVGDLIFTVDADHLKVDDFRLDDTPYPISQLVTSVAGDDTEATAADVTGSLELARRDMDGSVQYLVAVHNGQREPVQLETATFTGANSTVPMKTTLLNDELADGTDGRSLVVVPGAFPGSAGTITIDVPRVSDAATTTTTTASSPPPQLRLAAPDWPTLTPRPVNTIRLSQSATTTSTTSTSTTVPTTGGLTPTVTVTVTAATTTSSATSSSTTTTTAP